MNPPAASSTNLPEGSDRSTWKSTLFRYGVAVGIILGAWACRDALTPLWGPRDLPFIFFYPGVVFAAWYGRWGPALLGLGLSVVLAFWFFMGPHRHSLGLDSRDTVALLAYLGVGCSLVLAIEGMHRANDRARRELGERKRSDEALVRNEQMLSLMFRSLPVGIALASLPEGRYVDVNESFIQLTGFRREELIGRTSVEIGLVPNFEERRRTLERLSRDGSLSNIESRIVTRSGEERCLLSHARVVKIEGIEHMLLSSVDVSDKRRAEEEIRRLNAELDVRVQERTAELEAFTYTVAHDLRAPLRAMQGFSDLVLEEAGERLEPDQREYLSRIGKAALRMDLLVRDLLSYSRLGFAEVSSGPVDLNLLVQDVLHHLEPELKKNHAEVVLAPHLPTVLGDRTGLAQVVANLVSNAAKFIRTGVRPVIRITSESRAGLVRLCVEDNGIGIAPEYREKVFGVFERLHAAEAYPGTGIGLAIVRRALDRMGGIVGMEPNEKHGSRFWFELRETSALPDPSSAANPVSAVLRR